MTKVTVKVTESKGTYYEMEYKVIKNHVFYGNKQDEALEKAYTFILRNRPNYYEVIVEEDK